MRPSIHAEGLWDPVLGRGEVGVGMEISRGFFGKAEVRFWGTGGVGGRMRELTLS